MIEALRLISLVKFHSGELGFIIMTKLIAASVARYSIHTPSSNDKGIVRHAENF